LKLTLQNCGDLEKSFTVTWSIGTQLVGSVGPITLKGHQSQPISFPQGVVYPNAGSIKNILSISTGDDSKDARIKVSADGLPTHYALIFSAHKDPPGVLWRVNRSDISMREIHEDQFKKWCTLFDSRNVNITHQEEVAGDETFKLSGSKSANWWHDPPYNLPALNPNWIKIMDDERWYVYSYQNKSAAMEHFDR
jgi:hypothetical protein